ncbi:MAG TPA: cytochrome c oxidase subunit 3 [Kofleriaceae bacterium]|jgi:cytochrome c oxidase subunit 3
MTPERAHVWRLAVWILIASEALLFAGLFALYAGYRAEYPETFARAASEDIAWMGGVNTMILIASSFAMTWAVVQAREDRVRAATWSLVIVIVLGLAFSALKLTEWGVHISDGIVAGAGYSGPDEGPGTRLFFTLYFLMTGLHLFHLAVGLALVVWMFVAARRGALRVLPLELVALYWNFVDLIWMFLWPMFYLLRVR